MRTQRSFRDMIKTVDKEEIENIDFTRLVSPSQVCQFSIETLKQSRKTSSRKLELVNIKGKASWDLVSADNECMNFYRCRSHKYPFVETFLLKNEE